MTVIVTKRLMLKHHEHPRTVEKMIQWLNDPEVVKFSEQRHATHTRYTQDKYIIGPAYGGPYRREFREIHTSDTFIGTIAAHIDKNNSVADVGILIGEKTEWGKGYGTEAWQAFCDVLLTGEGVRKIEAGCMVCNSGMIKIFHRTKMKLEGYRPYHFLLNGTPYDLVQYSRFQ